VADNVVEDHKGKPESENAGQHTHAVDILTDAPARKADDYARKERRKNDQQRVVRKNHFIHERYSKLSGAVKSSQRSQTIAARGPVFLTSCLPRTGRGFS
jgi:hypothetical protein